MPILSPITWDEAMAYARSRSLMPTSMSSRELSLLDSEIRMRSVFAARLTNASVVQELKTGIERLMAGETNEATVRMELQQLMDMLGYDPTQGGFPGEEPAPPAERGELRDLSSDRRVKLMVETNFRQTANFAYRKQGLEEETRWQFPAWELVRIYPRMVPRGFRTGKGGVLEILPGDSWEERWVRAGGKLYGGRMIAAKGDPVWDELGNSGVFDDGLDTPYPPFAFNSGFGWKEVPRDEALALGVEGLDDLEDIGDEGLNDELDINNAAFDDDIFEALGKSMAAEIAAMKLKNRQDDESLVVLNRCLAVVDALCNGSAMQPRDSLGRWVDMNGGGLSLRHNIARGKRAVDRAMRTRKDVQKAMYRKEVGQIDFVWGRPGSPKRDASGKTHADGYGISHISAKHGEKAARDLPTTLAKGKIIHHDETATKRYVFHKNNLAVLKMNNDKTAFSISHFEDPKKIDFLQKKNRPNWLAGK